ncbi:GNAT family N-acetyltransferase [Epibacterium ulvae]|uniref:GNAT family N-acetyltransferase n=1 Tax=Epibacterium ulvae TaxID=1156985 RepID=UPI00248F5FA9|nr:GNAT family N-acetyltransferase [Epibacterium ulvae]
MQLREFTPNDAEDWARIFHAAVHELAAQHYSPAQRNAWSAEPATYQKVLDHVKDHQVWVAVDDTDRAQAFIELEDNGHIDCFYCHPDVAGQGVGRALYEHLEAEARKAGIARLFVEASETAKGFFIRQEFVELERCALTRNSVMLHNYRMEKRL